MSDLSVDATAGGAEPVPAPVAVPEVAAAPAAAPEPPPVVVIPVPEGSEAYETLTIVYARFEGEPLQAFIKELKGIFTAAGATVNDANVIGRRPLAYKIKKQSEGIYINFIFTAPPASIREIERDLGHHEQVMRYLTTRAVRA